MQSQISEPKNLAYSVHVSSEDVLYFAFTNSTGGRLTIVGKPIGIIGSPAIKIFHEYSEAGTFSQYVHSTYLIDTDTEITFVVPFLHDIAGYMFIRFVGFNG